MGDETPEPLTDHQQEILDDNSSDSYKGRTEDTEGFTPPPVSVTSPSSHPTGPYFQARFKKSVIFPSGMPKNYS
jgi:hypothetical protein